MSHPKQEKSMTALVGWTIKGIEIETRIAVQKAAKKEGLTLGKYCNTKLREAAHDTLKTSQEVVDQDQMQQAFKTHLDALKEDLPQLLREALKEIKPSREGWMKKLLG